MKPRRIVVRVLEGAPQNLESRVPGEGRIELEPGDQVEIRIAAREFDPPKTRIITAVVNQHRSLGWSQRLV